MFRTLIFYADDFLIICNTYSDALSSKLEIERLLLKRGLRLNENKTRIVNTLTGFDFLGFNFVHRLKRGYKHVNIADTTNGIEPCYHKYISTIVIPSSKSVKSIKSKLSAIFQALFIRGDNVAKLIKQVNPIIRGYCESKRAGNLSQVAGRITNNLYILQMRWIRRAHPLIFN